MKLVTPYKYAQLCNVSPQAINQRIVRKTLPVIAHTTPDGKTINYIDTDENPPVQYDKARRAVKTPSTRKAQNKRKA